LVQQVKIRASNKTQLRGVGGVWRSREYKEMNVGGNAIILSDIGVSGDANVDGGMNVRNADMLGNVMRTTTSSLVQQVKIRATTESANTISGRWWCLVGREYKET
jgi:hypothetical protein